MTAGDTSNAKSIQEFADINDIERNIFLSSLEKGKPINFKH